MSFGKRKRESARPYQPSEDDFEQAKPNSDAGSIVFYALFGITGIALALGYSMLGKPPYYTYSMGKQYYSRMDAGVYGMSSMMIESERKKVEARLGIDISKILTSAKMEKTTAMQQVAIACLPQGRSRSKVMPNQAHKIYPVVSDYLSCAMQMNRKRFCEANERTRLTEQLEQYLTFRQHIFAVERNREKMLSGRQAQYMVKMAQKIQGDQENTVHRNPNPKIGIRLDGRIAQRLGELARDGYLFPSDFSWLGLSVPKVYAPYIKISRDSVGTCV